MKTKERDTCLDFYRGIAAISIVLIHTVYWSGGGYLGESILYTLVLMVDVPLFVFLSGWSAFYTSCVEKTFLNLLKIWFQYAIFILMLDIICNVIWHSETFSAPNFLAQLVFAGSTAELPVVSASMWFMPVWIPIVLVGSSVTVFLKSYPKGVQNKWYFYTITFLLIGVFQCSITNKETWFLMSRNFCFYMIFYLLGYVAADYHPHWRLRRYLGICAVLLLSWFIVSQSFQIPAKGLQETKFPPHLMYLVASLFSIVTTIYLRDKIHQLMERCSIVCFVGRNALAFYFTQGIGASLIYYVYPHIISRGPYVTLAACFMVNLAITGILGLLLIQIYWLVFHALLRKLVSMWKRLSVN